MAFIYLHGGGWHYLDKDFGTRPWFRHLAAQGHVVMDVAYRLCPEVDLAGMVGDVKRAIAWMKCNAARLGVDPERVVIAGGSGGGHLALLAAYTPGLPALTPDELTGANTGVRAVASFYGTDVRAYYHHAGRVQARGALTRVSDDEDENRFANLTTWMTRKVLRAPLGKTFTHDEMMRNLMGGSPDEAPATYDLASPFTYAGPTCPPTLLLHGEHDCYMPVESARDLVRRLTAAGVPALCVEFPQTEHAFDVALGPLSQHSPPARAAMYDVDRFLALMAVLPANAGRTRRAAEPLHTGRARR